MEKNIIELYQKHWNHVSKLYNNLLEHSEYENIVIYSGALKYPFRDDIDYPFKASPYFIHWLPVTNNPHCYLIISRDKKPVLCFNQPHDYWHKVAETPSEFWVPYFEIRIIRNQKDVEKSLPLNRDKTAFIGEIDSKIENFNFTAINPDPLIKQIDFSRSRKTEYEIHCIRQANKTAILGHKAAKEAYYSGASAFEIHTAYLSASEHLEQDLPYHNIIGMNESAAIIHNYEISLKRLPLNKRFSLLLDAGTRFNGYASDITRTYAYETDNEFCALIQEMDKLQQSICASLKIGNSFVDAQKICHYKIAKLLFDFQIINMPIEAIVEDGISKVFFPHGLGHLLGLQVHDAGGWQSTPEGDVIVPPNEYQTLRCTKKLEPGHVITVEPGLYFIDLLLNEHQSNSNFNWSLINKLKPYGGIRIEDNVVIHEDFVENITRDLGL